MHPNGLFVCALPLVKVYPGSVFASVCLSPSFSLLFYFVSVEHQSCSFLTLRLQVHKLQLRRDCCGHVLVAIEVTIGQATIRASKGTSCHTRDTQGGDLMVI